MGIFMQDQHNDNITANNTMALMGGKMYINPSSGGGTTVAGQTAALAVMNGNVGIGTWVPGSALNVVGNVGIGSVAPEGSLDVGPSGTLCFGSSCKTSWANSGNYWTLTGGTGNVGISTINSVGIGTSSGIGAGLVVMNGNVGIGTWVPAKPLSVAGDEYNNGNIGIGTTFVGGAGEGALTVMNGNVGIGTWVPAAALHVYSAVTESGLFERPNTSVGSNFAEGVLRLRMSGTSSVGRGNGLVFDLTDSAGATNTSGMISNYWINNISGSVLSGMSFYLDVAGGPQLGTAVMTLTESSSLGGGNVGIGTWVPAGALDIKTGNNVLVESGNVGIGTTTPQTGFAVVNGNVGIGTWTANSALQVVGNVGIGSVIPYGSLDVGPSGTLCFGSSCKTSWANSGNYWTLTGGTGNVGISTINTVGIGTSSGIGAGLVVMNGNVGIGTWVPSKLFQVGSGAYPLTVDSNANLSVGGNISTYGTITANSEAIFNIYSNNGGAGTSTFLQGGGGTNSYLTLQSVATAPAGNYGSTDYIDFEVGNGSNTANKDAMRIVSGGNVGVGTTTPQAGFVVTNGNVGIGTWIANSALQVVGNVGIGSVAPAGSLDVSPSGTICFGSSCKTSWASATNYWLLAGGTGNVGISTMNTVGIGTTAGVGAGLVVMNGNVGIGTWVPAKPLSVAGDEYNNGNIGIGTTFVGGANEGALVVMNGNVGIGTWTPAQALEVNGGIQIDGSGSSYFSSGNVGIGSVAPNYKLDVEGGDVNASGGLCINGSCVSSWNGVFPSGTTGQTLYNNSGTWTATSNLYNNGTNVGIGTATPQTGLAVVSNNVGIGTWTANSALQVVGNVGIGSVIPYGSLDVSPTGTICFGSSCKTSWASSSNYWSLAGGTGNVGINTTNTVGIGTTSGVGAGLVVMNGNVGIGTWVPALPLSVAGNSYFNGNVGIGTTAPGSNLSVLNNISVGAYAINTAPTGGIIVSGSVGIGTTTPNANLNVYGNLNGGVINSVQNASSGNVAYAVQQTVSDTGSMFFQSFSSGNTTGWWGVSGAWNEISSSAGNGMILGPRNSTPLIMGTGSNEYMRINKGGNIGIGTQTPQTGLAIVSNNVGIGTWTANSALQVVGNVGIGSVIPYGSLDVGPTGTICFGSSCKGTWAGVGTNYWSLAGGTGNVGISTTNTVGIGTTAGVGAGLVVMNGNVGIGTWVPQSAYRSCPHS